jgi:hypothetical protein
MYLYIFGYLVALLNLYMLYIVECNGDLWVVNWKQIFLNYLDAWTAFVVSIQRLQSKVLLTITNAPWYVSNYTLHTDLQIPFITEEIKIYTQRYTITD